MSSLGLSSLFNVKDKVVMITGGGRGIGKMMADGFVQNGARVYIASRDLKACNVTAQELTARGPGQCFALEANLQSEAGCKQLAAAIAKQETQVDVLINNSGVSWGGDFDHHPESAWTKVLTVNVTAPFHLIKFLLPLLDAAAVTSDAARIINVGSVAGLVPQPIDTIAYDTSKAAVHHMTRVLAAKLARRPNGGHILVNAIAPGLVPSKMSKGISMVTGQAMDDLATRIPIGRLGQDADMAGLAIFLSSKASGWISGMVIASDGGQVYAVETGVGSAKLYSSDFGAYVEIHYGSSQAANSLTAND
uniref:Glycoside hydrolase n=1 Tax=Peronospora matthiolae TaxID=2874970 RepID=A0AAV1URA0_9STRA